MHNTQRANRINLILDTINSLTVEEFLDVAQIDGLKKSGQRWRGKCPIHGGDSGAFAVYTKPEGIFYNCPSNCGSGNTVKLIGKLNNLSTKGRDFVSIVNLAAQRIGLPGIEGGELTGAQLIAIEARQIKAKQEKEKRIAEELRVNVLTHKVLMSMFLNLRTSPKIVSYLQERKLADTELAAQALGARAWRPTIVSDMLADFSRDELREVLGPADKLQEQFIRRPLMMFSFNGNQCTGVQGRSIDPLCDKKWRYIGRGNLSLGFFGGEQLVQAPAPVVVVEGMTDTIIGRRYPEFAAGFFDGKKPFILGKAGSGKMSKKMAEILKGRDVVLVFDGDKAGIEGAALSAATLEGIAKSVRYTNTTDGDLCDMIVNAKNG